MYKLTPKIKARKTVNDRKDELKIEIMSQLDDSPKHTKQVPPEDAIALMARCLEKLANSSSNQMATTLASINPPQFSGAPGEDLNNFLANFNRETLALGDDLKCIALTKSLTLDAAVWARNSRELAEAGNDWSEVVKALKARFGDASSNSKKLEKLTRLKFDANKKTLISYVENFNELYRSVHPETPVSLILLNLNSKLPASVKYQLEIIEPDWLDYTSMSQFYSLVKRVDKALQLHAAQETAKQASIDDLATLVRDLHKRQVTKSTQETLAAVVPSSQQNQSLPPPLTQSNPVQQQQVHNSNTATREPRQNYRYDSDRTNYNTNCDCRRQDRGQRYQDRNNSYNNDHRRGLRDTRQHPYQRDANNNGSNSHPNYRQNQQTFANPASTRGPPQFPNNSELPDVIRRYYELYSKPPGPCPNCHNGNHWARHCPFHLALNRERPSEQAKPLAEK